MFIIVKQSIYMKTITKNGEFKRVSETDADSKVKFDGWQFCAKSKMKGSKQTVVQENVVEDESATTKTPYQKKKKS